jgi:hypothetical protein
MGYISIFGSVNLRVWNLIVTHIYKQAQLVFDMKVITTSFPIARKVVIEILGPIFYILHCSSIKYDAAVLKTDMLADTLFLHLLKQDAFHGSYKF